MNIQFNRAGTWQEVSKEEFLELVSKGVIRPETEVIINDKKGVAAKINGLVFPSKVAEPPQANPKISYFYTDANGQKQGPFDDQQLQALATQGVIAPKTPLETNTGREWKAGWVPELRFDTPVQPAALPQSVPHNIIAPVAEKSKNSLLIPVIGIVVVVLLVVCGIFASSVASNVASSSAREREKLIDLFHNSKMVTICCLCSYSVGNSHTIVKEDFYGTSFKKVEVV